MIDLYRFCIALPCELHKAERPGVVCDNAKKTIVVSLPMF